MADTHLRHEGVRVPDGDILIHAGDLLAHGSLDELGRAVRWLASFPHRAKVVVAGNHEVCLQKYPLPARAMLEDAGLVYLEDGAATVDGLAFYGSPWQPRFRIWAFGAARGAELASKWAKIPAGVDVLVTHGPPHGFGDRIVWRDVQRRVGCVDLLARVREVRPALHLFGHIHQDPGRWPLEEGARTTLANVTTDDGRLPASVFDL